MTRLADLEICWDGPASTSFLEDIAAPRNADLGLGAYFVITAKKKSLTDTDHIAAIGAAAALVATIDQKPILTGLIATILLAAISPVSLEIVSDEEGELLGIINKLKTGYAVDEERLRTMLRIDSVADRLIESLSERGILWRAPDKTLKIQRKVLVNIKIGSRA